MNPRTEQRPSWDSMYITMCYLVSLRSDDPSSAIGAVITDESHAVRSIGLNGLPRGIDDHGIIIEDGLPHRRSPIDGAKYQWTEHAERNAIYNAGRIGTQIQGCTLYVNLLPCCDCARGIIQSGISRVVVHKQGHHKFLETRGQDANVWTKDFEMVSDMLIEAGVNFDWFDEELRQPEAFFSGQTINIADLG